MEDNNQDLSQSAMFLKEYKILLHKVNERFRVRDAKWLKISQPKASRVLNGIQFDILTLIDMAVFVGYDVELFFKVRVDY